MPRVRRRRSRGAGVRRPRSLRRRARRRRGGRARSAGRRGARGRRTRTSPDARSRRSGRASARFAIGSFPPDSASSVRASVRRMCVWRSVAKTAAASVGGDDGAEQHRLEPGEVEEPVGGHAGEQRADDDADRAQEGRRHRDLAQPPPRRLQPALVQDQREPDDPDAGARAPRRRTRSRRARRSRAASRARGTRRARASPVRARSERDDDARREDGADEQEYEAFVHVSYLPRWESRPPRGTLPGWRRVRGPARSAGCRKSRRSRSGTASATSSSATS